MLDLRLGEKGFQRGSRQESGTGMDSFVAFSVRLPCRVFASSNSVFIQRCGRRAIPRVATIGRVAMNAYNGDEQLVT